MEAVMDIRRAFIGVLNSVLPHRMIRPHINEYKQTQYTLRERLRKFAVGTEWHRLGELDKGHWVEVEKGMMARMIILPCDLQLILDRVTIVETKALCDVELTEPHCHMTPDGARHQVTFVEKGVMDVCIHEEDTDVMKTRIRLHEGEVIHILPTQWHTVKLERETELLTIIFPAL